MNTETYKQRFVTIENELIKLLLQSEDPYQNVDEILDILTNVRILKNKFLQKAEQADNEN